MVKVPFGQIGKQSPHAVELVPSKVGRMGSKPSDLAPMEKYDKLKL